MGIERWVTRRRNAALEMQQQVLVQLVMASFVLFALLLGVGYGLVLLRSTHSPRAITPVLEAFMRAGAESDVLTGHRQLTNSALRRYSRDDVATLFAQRDLFAGFESVRVSRLQFRSAAGPSAVETAEVEAVAGYAELPPARLTALLALEDGEWRLEWVRVSREPAAP